MLSRRTLFSAAALPLLSAAPAFVVLTEKQRFHLRAGYRVQQLLPHVSVEHNPDGTFDLVGLTKADKLFLSDLGWVSSRGTLAANKVLGDS